FRNAASRGRDCGHKRGSCRRCKPPHGKLNPNEMMRGSGTRLMKMEAKMLLSAMPLRCAFGAIVLFLLACASPAMADAGFQRWVSQFRSVVASSGISHQTFDRAFRGVTAPDPEVLEKARY